MAVIANTAKTYELKGLREDLSNVISNISPEETPFMSNSGRETANNTYAEWQTDSLAATDTANAQAEGDDIAAFDAIAPTTRLGNYTQISRKTLILSDTAEVVDKAGRKSELAYQLAKKGKELKRDMEAIMLANTGAVAGSAGVARKAGSLLAFIKTNTNIGTGGTPAGANPVYTTTPTAARTDNSTTRPFTEVILKDVVQQAWTSGASVKTVMVGATVKQAISGFNGIATKTYYQSKAEVSAIIGAADVYVSDFGTLSIVPNRFQRPRDVFFIDWDYVAVAYLRPFRQVPLAKTGDAEKRMMIAEYTLKVKNEAALGLAADIS